MKREKAHITLTLDEAMRHDLILFNNPVLIQGLALTPVLAAAHTLKVALALCLTAFILIIPTRFIGDLLVGYVPRNLRPFVYAVISALCYIPAILLIDLLFGTEARGLENFLVLLVVDGIVLSRAEIPVREGALRALRNGFFTALGFAPVILLVGFLRELLTEGKVWGTALLKNGPLGIAGTAAGGLILVALLSALLQWAAAAYKRFKIGGSRAND